jgi:hypothetical protein
VAAGVPLPAQADRLSAAVAAMAMPARALLRIFIEALLSGEE